MNWMKMAGALMVVGASTLIGLFYSGKAQARLEDLQEFKKALVILKGEIRFALAPFGEAAASAAMRTRQPVSQIFRRVCDLLAEDSGAALGGLWQKAVQEAKADSYFTAEDLQAMASFGKNLGLMDRELQGQAIDLLIDYIDQSAAHIAENGERQSKMYRSLGFLSGLLITIIMI